MVKPNQVHIGKTVWYDHPDRGLEEVVVNECFLKNITYDSMLDIKDCVAGRTYLKKPEGTTNRIK